MPRQDRPLLPEEQVQRNRALKVKAPADSRSEIPQRRMTPQPSSSSTTRQQEMVERNGAWSAQASGSSLRPETASRRNKPQHLAPNTILRTSHIEVDVRSEGVGSATRNEQINATFPVSRRWQEHVSEPGAVLRIGITLML
jgi:hypothetical protein